jgi:hypothetical protein
MTIQRLSKKATWKLIGTIQRCCLPIPVEIGGGRGIEVDVDRDANDDSQKNS